MSKISCPLSKRMRVFQKNTFCGNRLKSNSRTWNFTPLKHGGKPLNCYFVSVNLEPSLFGAFNPRIDYVRKTDINHVRVTVKIQGIPRGLRADLKGHQMEVSVNKVNKVVLSCLVLSKWYLSSSTKLIFGLNYNQAILLLAIL